MTSTNDPDRIKGVLAIIEREVHAASSGDAAGYFSILDEEATFLPPNLPPKQGDELREWLRDFLERFAIEWIDFIHEETEVAGDLAYHRYAYSWRVTARAGGPPTVAQGKGLHVLRRRPGAGWKILCEIWNASPAPGSSVS